MFPAVHARHVVDLAKRWGVSGRDLLGPLGIPEALLDDPHARLPIGDVVRLIERAQSLTGEPGLGFYLALEMRSSWHGYLGFAAMAAATLREAIELAERYIPTRTDALALHLVVDGNVASVVVEERTELGAGREVIIVALLLGLATIGSSLTGKAMAGHAELALPEPPYFPRFRHLFSEVSFSRPTHRLVFPAASLDMPLTLGDPAALRLATERCEEELKALGFGARTSAKVRALLSAGARFPTIDDTARAVGMSARTLKRRLAEENTSYSELLDDVRHRRALLLLADDKLTLTDVAERLGYADAASFGHAFQRWTGQTPAAARKARFGT